MGPDPTTHAEDASARSSRRVLLVGLAIVALLLLRVAFGDQPWDERVQARLAEGQPRGFQSTYVWWASLANAAIVLALVATRRLWLPPSRPSAELSRYATPPASRALGRAFTVLLLAAALLFATLAAPRLFQSMWGDEEHTTRQAIVGSWYWVDGELRRDDKRWRDTLYYYTQGNNPVPMSALAKVSRSVWMALGGDPWRCEPALRAFAFVFGILSVLLSGLFLRRVGLPVAGLLAAFLLALHPWHLAYTTQIRAYPLVLALVPASLYATVAVLERGCWRRWAVFGALQFLMLWVYPGALWFVVTLSAALALAILLHHRHSGAWREQILRLGVTGVVSGAAWLQLMLPNLMQFTEHLRERATAPMPPGTVRDMLSYAFAGMPWPDRSPSPFHPELADLAAAHPVAVPVVAAACLVLLGIGTVRLARRGHFVALAAIWIPAPLTVLFAELRTLYLYPWYVTFGLPGAAMLVAAGADGFGSRLRAPRARLAASAAAGLAFLLAFAWISEKPRSFLRSYSYEPFRESVEAMRPSLDPLHPENARILTAVIHGETRYYDPLAVKTETVEELEAMMERARSEEKPLFVSFGRLDLVRARFPEVLERLGEGRDFELVAAFPAFLPRYDRYVYHYREGPPGEVRSRGVLGRVESLEDPAEPEAGRRGQASGGD